MDDTGNWQKKTTLSTLLFADKQNQWLSYWLQFATKKKIPLGNKHMRYPNRGRKQIRNVFHRSLCNLILSAYTQSFPSPMYSKGTILRELCTQKWNAFWINDVKLTFWKN